MFILRKIFNDKDPMNATQSNQIIGESYTVVDKGSDKYEELMESTIWSIFRDSIYSFILTEDGQKVIPLHKGQSNYIMTARGKTFSNMTHPEDKTS